MPQVSAQWNMILLFGASLGYALGQGAGCAIGLAVASGAGAAWGLIRG